MSVLIANDPYIVFKPTREKDEHGWAQEGTLSQSASEIGNIQRSPNPQTAVGANDRDSGPNEPFNYVTATGHLDPATVAEEGDTLITNHGSWRVSSLTLITDPVGGNAESITADLVKVIE